MRYLSTAEIQTELLAMLDSFDDICAEHGIRYTLDGGTLLGSVRHGGFIPWDDDIDIIVPRPDFDKLASHPEWVPAGLYLERQGESDYLYPYMKLVNPIWSAQEPFLSGCFDEHLWLDIFPADSMPDSSSERARLMMLQARTSKRAGRSYINIEASTTSSFKKILKQLLFPLHRIFFSAVHQYMKLSSRAKKLPYGSTREVGNVVWGPYKPDKPGFPIEDFDNLIEVEFEGRTFKACPHWDGYLRGLYGDYMRLPPEDQRVTHGVKVWKA